MFGFLKYTADGNFLILPNQNGQEEKVPAALIDELIERNLSIHDLEQLLFVRNHTVDGHIVCQVPIAELRGKDLTGKIIGTEILHLGSDNNWLSTDKALTVGRSGSSYAFIFPEEYENCHDGDCAHLSDNAKEGDQCEYVTMQGYTFTEHKMFLIKDKA